MHRKDWIVERSVGRKRRFLVLPGRGISGPAMAASVFQDRTSQKLVETLDSQLGRFDKLARADSVIPFAADAREALASTVLDEQFEIISQRFEDGPATVAMTDSARLALQAGNPDLRIVPITRYYLPGDRPIRGKKAAQLASHTAAETATDAAGNVFMSDLKQLLPGPATGAQGRNVQVAVLDSGVDASHPALGGAVTALRCFIPGESPGAGGPVNWGAAHADRAGHGTHVAGIIAARAGQGGPPGVAPNAQIVSYRIFPNSASGLKPAENPVIIDSIRAAIDDGCHIINLSIEGSTLKEDGVRSAVADAWNNGVVCIAAAGNGSGNPVSFPAALQHCVAVTAIGREGCFPNKPSFRKHVSDQRAVSDEDVFLASFSNYGPRVQFTAPGHAIVSTFPGGQWWFSSGTSMAAPYVSGMLAVALSDNGNVLAMAGNAERSAAMLQMLVSRARVLGLPQRAQEGFGLPS